MKVSQFHDVSALDFFLSHESLIVNKEILSNMSLILKRTIVMRIMPERQPFITFMELTMRCRATDKEMV